MLLIANAGVIVNNNIVLIDTYDRLRREGVPAYEAILETCRERARPVVLTAVTAILGVLPIAFGMNIEFLTREITIGAPATQWWIHLSTAIVFGLGFATVLTLVVTPAALMAIANVAAWRERRRRWAQIGRRATAGHPVLPNRRHRRQEHRRISRLSQRAGGRRLLGRAEGRHRDGRFRAHHEARARGIRATRRRMSRPARKRRAFDWSAAVRS